MKNQERERGKKKNKGRRGRKRIRLSCAARFNDIAFSFFFINIMFNRGNPPPTLYWTLNGKVVQNSVSTKIITKE